jgi:hydrogenase maturation factor
MGSRSLLRPGKLAPETLARLLARIPHRDPRVLLGPAVGRDAAVIDMGGGRVLVAKTDPVTFAAEDIGWYAVHVNANDVACMGARPVWMMATALLPPGAPSDLPEWIFDQLLRATDALGIELVGGHTEVTIGLDRPIVIGAMLGEAMRDEIVTGEGIEPGDAVVLARGIAIEGTALLAREAAGALLAAGCTAGDVRRAHGLLYEPGISVVAAAAALRSVTRPRLMHDPTEGGLATALQEMAAAAGRRLRVDATAVDVHAETMLVCEALRLDPLGLLASGALLAIVPAADVGRVTGIDNGSMFRRIGSVEPGPPEVIMGTGDIPFPVFDRDELARFFEGAAGGERTD